LIRGNKVIPIELGPTVSLKDNVDKVCKRAFYELLEKGLQ
jgi:hypothetical protein